MQGVYKKRTYSSIAETSSQSAGDVKKSKSAPSGEKGQGMRRLDRVEQKDKSKGSLSFSHLSRAEASPLALTVIVPAKRSALSECALSPRSSLPVQFRPDQYLGAAPCPSLPSSRSESGPAPGMSTSTMIWSVLSALSASRLVPAR